MVAKQHHAGKRGGAEIEAVGSAITSQAVLEGSSKERVIACVAHKATKAIATGNTVTPGTPNDQLVISCPDQGVAGIGAGNRAVEGRHGWGVEAVRPSWWWET